MSRYPKTQVRPGAKFGSLVVIEEVERQGYNRRVLCRCDCGSEKIAYLNNLHAGRTTSCGCTYTYGAAARDAILTERRARAKISENGRICLTCNEFKPWSAFPSDKRHSTGRASNCLDCGRWRSVVAQYGISKHQWHALFEEQGGGCALCEQPSHERRLSVDHDHSCCGPAKACLQCIRGLLCDTCNRMIGLVERKPKIRELFAFYLGRRPLSTRS